jgi:hypothetical protein
VIRKLVGLGNSVEQVSKWIGHRTLDVTFRYYFGISATQAAKTMNIPWLQSENGGGALYSTSGGDTISSNPEEVMHSSDKSAAVLG